jgi:hypothetical protein
VPLETAERPVNRVELFREEARLALAFRRALALSLALPLSVIGCSHTRSSPNADLPNAAKEPEDACVPKLTTVFFGVIDGSSECRATQSLACGLPKQVRVLDGGCSIKSEDCRAVCPSYGAFNCQVTDASCPGGKAVRDGPVSVSCDFCPGGIGRRPHELVMHTRPSPPNALAAYFERAAFLEAASVRAFDELHAALASACAPEELLVAARRAARDEVTHLRATARLARRFGGRAPPSARDEIGATARDEIATRSLEAVARHNAIEGCVRETYGALLASFQATHARDAQIRRALGTIAVDETRHAALSWAIHRWASIHLKSASWSAVQIALRSAIAELHGEVREPPEDLVRFAGLPSAVEQRRLLFELEEHIWS